jgi:hypothetical protein
MRSGLETRLYKVVLKLSGCFIDLGRRVVRIHGDIYRVMVNVRHGVEIQYEMPFRIPLTLRGEWKSEWTSRRKCGAAAHSDGNIICLVCQMEF